VKKKHIKLTVLIILLSFQYCFAQNNIKLNENYLQILYEKFAFDSSISLNLSVKPYINTDERFNNYLQHNVFRLRTNYSNKKNWLSDRYQNGDLYNHVDNSQKTKISINPLLNFNIGYSSIAKRTYDFNRGIQFNVNYDNKLFISSSVYENLSSFPQYIKNYVDSLSVVPGMGKARSDSLGRVYDYNLPIGFIIYKPSKNFHFELGHDKNFIGSGYRSLLLSDFSYPYPYFKSIMHFGDFTLMNLWTQFIDASKGWVNNNGYNKKYAAFNTVTFSGIKNFQLTLYQAMLWTNTDSSGNVVRPFNAGYYVPLIYLNSLNFNDGSPGNSLIGLDLNYKIKNKYLFYFQLMVDDYNIKASQRGSGFFQDKTGIQIGVKGYDFLNIKNLFVRYEFNTVRPYSYRNKEQSIAFTNYGEALAHPLGANFKEHIINLKYRYKKFLIESDILLAKYGADSSHSDWGRNIFKSDYSAQMGIFSYGNKTLQGVLTNLTMINVRLNYLLNANTNSRIFFNLSMRKENNFLYQNTENFFSFGISTNLINVDRLF